VTFPNKRAITSQTDLHSSVIDQHLTFCFGLLNKTPLIRHLHPAQPQHSSLPRQLFGLK
jgi:hypothetical protein